MKRSPGSTTIKDCSTPLVPSGRVVKRETTKRGHTSRRFKSKPATCRRVRHLIAEYKRTSTGFHKNLAHR